MLIQQITREEEIDALRPGVVVGISTFTNNARYQGVMDNMLVFTYKITSDRIGELWLEREWIRPGTLPLNHGSIELRPGIPYEPIEYTPRKNVRLFQFKKSQLEEVGIK